MYTPPINPSPIKDFINNTDITVIQESWLQKGDKLKFIDHLFFKANRKKSKKAKRGSEGVLIFYKVQYAKGICREKSSDEKHVIWIKCCKQFLAYKRIHILQAAIFHHKSLGGNPRISKMSWYLGNLKKILIGTVVWENC